MKWQLRELIIRVVQFNILQRMTAAADTASFWKSRNTQTHTNWRTDTTHWQYVGPINYLQLSSQLHEPG
jgi:hypothetical protein